MSELVNKGIDNGCINGTRFEKALATFLGTNKNLISNPTVADGLPYSITNHVMCHFTMLRHMIAEEQTCAGPRRYPKSGGFRRSLKSTDYEWLNPLLEQATPRTELSLVAVPPGKPEDDVSVDENGWPTIFSFLSKCEAPDRKLLGRARSRSSSLASQRTQYYDEHGMPLFNVEDTAAQQPTKPGDVEQDLFLETPRSRTRKLGT